MKRLLMILSVTVFFASCNNFIDLDPISQQSTNKFYRDSLEMDQALTAAYNALISTDQYGGDGYSSFMEVTTDNTWNKNTTMAGGAYASFDNFTLSTTNVQIEQTWVSCYNGIQRCNIVITRLQNSTTISEGFKAKKMGEACFLRALTYFNMVRIWGGVPLITEEVTNVNDAFNHVRSTPEQVYEQIIKDLEYAASNLPASYDATNVGRATKGAAQALLAKVYLTRQDWQQSLSLLNTVISSGQYDLLPDFAQVFSVENKNNKESLFEVQFDKTLEGQGYMGKDPLMVGGDINNLPSDNLLKFFEENPDDRKEATVIDLGIQGWRMYKWHDTKGPNNGLGFNIIVLRYADVLLMAAEAMNEIGYGQQNALEYLNKIRTRSHAKEYTYSDLPNQESFREAIAKERRLELAFENHRWFDLVRTNKALDVLNKSEGASMFPLNVQKYQLLFPIPQAEIDASGKKLGQNEGYN